MANPIDPQPERKLGKLAPRSDPRTIQLAKHFNPTAAPIPPAARWDAPIDDWGVMGNDTYGNCVIVTAAHAILTWRANELDDNRRITDNAVIELSRTMGALNGYNILDRLKYWRNEGMWTDYLWMYAQTPTTNVELLKAVIYEFGLADIGLALPNAWRNAAIWDTGTGRDYRAGSWGLHSVPIVGYDQQYAYIATWGKLQPMTWPAVTTYCDEAYALISGFWLANAGTTPSGFNLETIRAELDTIRSQ